MIKIQILFDLARKMKIARLLILAVMVFFLVFSTAPYTHAEDNENSRILIELPDGIKEKTVKIMRDHLNALQDTITLFNLMTTIKQKISSNRD